MGTRYVITPTKIRYNNTNIYYMYHLGVTCVLDTQIAHIIHMKHIYSFDIFVFDKLSITYIYNPIAL